MATAVIQPNTVEEKLIEELGYDDHFHDHHHGDKYQSNFITTYIFSQDHKIIAKQFLITGMFWAIIGGLFVVEALSVIIQVLYFKRTGKRVFLMAPIHHHFEKKGWAEPTIVIRFWIIAVILALIGLATLKLR